jgi:hypothetical protein
MLDLAVSIAVFSLLIIARIAPLVRDKFDSGEQWIVLRLR